jgi:hypothetical protein
MLYGHLLPARALAIAWAEDTESDRERREVMTTRQRLAWALLPAFPWARVVSRSGGAGSSESGSRVPTERGVFYRWYLVLHEFVEKSGAELTATFYSPKRNSCICETRRQPVVIRGPLTYELHDCLSLERLAETSEASYGGPDSCKRSMDERQRQKDALK